MNKLSPSSHGTYCRIHGSDSLPKYSPRGRGDCNCGVADLEIRIESLEEALSILIVYAELHLRTVSSDWDQHPSLVNARKLIGS